MSRLEETRKTYQNAVEKLHTDRDYFTEWLKYSGRFYKIPAAHTMALFESNPKATIFGDFDTWKKYGNSVKFQERSSAALIENGSRLKHYFEISQTTAVNIPFQWSIDKDITEEFLKDEARIGGRNYRNLASYINTVAVKHISDNAEEILSRFPVNEADRKAFLYSVSTMVMTVIAARCEYKSTYKYQTPNIPDLSALDMLKTNEDTVKLCNTVQQSAKAILSKMEKSITQIINIRTEALKNERNRNDEADRGMEQQVPQQQSGIAGASARERETGNDLVRGSTGVVSDVHDGGKGHRDDSIQAEQGTEFHVQSGVLGRDGGNGDNRVLRQEMAGVYGAELSRHGADNEYQQLGLGDGIEESGYRSGGTVSEVGRTVSESKSTSHNVYGDSQVGENEAIGDRSRGNGDGGAPVSGELKVNTEEKTAEASKGASAVLRDTYSTNFPTITCEFSESPVFEDGKVYSVYDFDRLMMQADDERVFGTKAAVEKYGSKEAWYNSDVDDEFTRFKGYDKVKFTINMPNGVQFTERQDIGDGYGGVIGFLSHFHIYNSIIPALKEARNIVRQQEIAEIQKRDTYITLNAARVGDFYELFGNEAKIAAEKLGLFVTQRNGVPMVGFPQHVLDEYKAKLEEQGYSLTLDENPDLKEILKRDTYSTNLQELIDQCDNGLDKFYVDRENEIVNHVYYNPDSSAGGQLVYNYFSFDELFEAITKEDPLEYLETFCKQELVDIDRPDFAVKARAFLENNEDFNSKDENFDKKLSAITEPRFSIIQLKDDEKLRDYRFASMADLQKSGLYVDRENYRRMYRGRLKFDETLDDIYARFNIDRPEDFEGHSLSVGDIIGIVKDGKSTAYYVDDVGFKEVPDFLLDKNERMARRCLTDNIQSFAEKQLASDEMDDLGDKLFDYENAPHYNNEKWLIGNGMMTARQFEDITARYHNGEDVRKELAKGLYGNNEGEQEIWIDKNPLGVDTIKFSISNSENGLTFSTKGGFEISYTWEQLGDAMITAARKEFDRHAALNEAYIKDGELYGNLYLALLEKRTIYLERTDGAKGDYRLEYIEGKGKTLTVDDSEGNRVEVRNFGVNGRGYVIKPLLEDNVYRVKEIEREPIFKVEANTQNTLEGEAFIRSYEKTDSNTLIPQEILYTGSLKDCNRYVEYLRRGESSREAIKGLWENEKAQSMETAKNFTITDQNLGTGGLKTKCAANIAAIKTLKQIEAENRNATPEEQEILSKYVGWGGMAQEVFSGTNEKWVKEHTELKELLTDEEYAAAQSSTLNAHYTTPTVINAIYKALDNMGFKKGKILEPSMGVGNFFGCIPEKMKDSQLYGVELDSITGRIAKQLYPNADIQIKGFEKTNYPDNFFDVAIGNVPFGSYGVADRQYDKHNFFIHDYFFAKTLDKVAEGGIIAFVTSKGTLDKVNPKVREYIAQRADLLGAIRLPNTAFKGNANTEVTSDIIFLQKRKNAPVKMPDWVYLGETADGIPVNQYFADNPEMMLGKMEYSKKMYGGKNNTACIPFEGEELSEQLDKAVSRLKTNIALKTRTEKQEKARGLINATEDVRNFTHTIIDGKVYFRENDIMKEKFIKGEPVTGKYLERITGLIELREKLRELIEAQSEGCTDEKLKELQGDLNNLYDRFTKHNGYINDKGNRDVFREDDDYNTLCALEIIDPEKHTATKSEIFTKRTVKVNTEITHVDNPQEALQVSLDMRGRVDIPYMAELCGSSHEQVIDRLVSEGIIYLNPEKYEEHGIGAYEEAAEYLSGNVRQKLRIAELAAETKPELFSRNVTALKNVIPPTIEAGEIKVRLGVSWVEPKDYQQFLCEYAKASFSIREPLRRTFTGEYKVPSNRDYSIAATSTYGTKRISSYGIMEQLLNNRDILIRDAVLDADGKKHYVINDKETQLAKDKARLMQSAFQRWIWENPERRQKYVTKYNELFNSIVGRKYDGSHQTFPEMSPYIELKPHQKDAVARTKYGGNTLLAHCVGAGKSFEMAAAVMEKKRLGLINKACMVVPKHLVGQTANEWLRLYPQAKLLVASEKDFSEDNRQKFIARCCTGDYAAVIMSYEQFEKIPMSFEYREKFMDREMEVLKMAIADTDKSDRGTIKDLERAKKNLEKRIAKLLDGGKAKDRSLNFEQLGFDCLVVDEAHNYKNGLVVTKMSRVAGVQTTPAQKSEDILMKTQYLNETYGCKNIIFATGTPVTNSMTELYTMQRYLRPDLLTNAGLQNFDDWASNFGEVVTQLELKPAGNGYRPKKRFSRFVNLPELMQMYKEFADIRTADMLNLPVPEIEGGKPQTVVSKPNDFQKAALQILADRSERIHSGSIDPHDDNMLKITNEARLLGLDARAINPTAENYPDSKVNMCIDNIMKIYEDTKEQKGVQAIFCDIAVNSDDGRFSVYDYIRDELEKRGIPKNEICAAGDAKNQNQRNEMYAQLRSGSKRIVLASTTKMGTGANVQTRLAAMHHLDIPWKPSDLEQRNGRIIRQGNTFDKVKIFNYVTEDTFDSYMLNIIINKQKFISQLMSGKSPARTCEDVDEMVLNYSEMQSLATGDPRIKEKIELDGEVARLRTLESEHYNNKYRLEDFIVKGEEKKANYERMLKICKADKEFSEANKTSEDVFSVKLGEKIYTERKEAAAVLQKYVLNCMVSGEPQKIGKFCGFDITVKRTDTVFGSGSPTLFLQQSNGIQHIAELSIDNDIGNITRMENILKSGVDKTIRETEYKLERLKADLQEAKQTKDTPFEFAAELETKAARLEQLNFELNKPDEVVMLDEDEEKDNPDLNEKLNNPKHKPKR